MILILLHFSSLNIRPLVLDQDSRLFKSSWSNIASVMESILRKILVSSAKHATVELATASGKSLTYKRKSIGPKILPCATPEHTSFWEEVGPRVVTRYWRSCRYEVNHWRRDTPMLYLRSLLIRAVWLTLSKAFDMSMKIISVCLPESKIDPM